MQTDIGGTSDVRNLTVDRGTAAVTSARLPSLVLREQSISL
jgi:hypothetical protein